jgi:hypothetical protein
MTDTRDTAAPQPRYNFPSFAEWWDAHGRFNAAAHGFRPSFVRGLMELSWEVGRELSEPPTAPPPTQPEGHEALSDEELLSAIDAEMSEFRREGSWYVRPDQTLELGDAIAVDDAVRIARAALRTKGE